MANKNRNNASWCCDRIEELIEEYKQRRDSTYDSEGEYLIYDKIIEDLEEILYG